METGRKFFFPHSYSNFFRRAALKIFARRPRVRQFFYTVADTTRATIVTLRDVGSAACRGGDVETPQKPPTDRGL